MILQIQDILDADQLSRISAALAYGEFEPGRETAGWAAEGVKHNLQLYPQGTPAEEAQNVITQAVTRSAEFGMAARPKSMRPALFARYEPGMEYGLHLDDPMMGGPTPMRTDVAFTVFLSEPTDYDGGELVIEGAYGSQSYKLAAGSLVLYPSSSLHRVTPVTRGIRLVAVSWVQSMVRDPARRQILYDLDKARRALFDERGKTAEFDLLTQSLMNLVRMWAEP